jgi:outer membrane protein OmpA-like peptidoglycan-associated protein
VVDEALDEATARQGRRVTSSLCPGPTRETVSGFSRYQNTVASLPPGEQQKLRLLAQRIVRSYQRGCRPIREVRLIGHADRDVQRGRQFENRISHERALAVRHALERLIGNRAISSRIRWDVRGVGSSQLVVQNPRTEAERRRNRRVDISSEGPAFPLRAFFSATPRPTFVLAAAPAVATAPIAAAEALIAALLATVALLVIIQLMPHISRSVEDILRRIQVLMAKMLDSVNQAVEGIEDLIRKNTRAGMRCSAEVIAFRELTRQLINELTSPRPADPIAQQQRVFRIANVAQKWREAMQALLECLISAGAT